MTPRLQRLHDAIGKALGSRIVKLHEQHGELTLEVAAADYRAVAETLSHNPDLGFEQLIDLCGLDYSAYGLGTADLANAATVHDPVGSDEPAGAGEHSGAKRFAGRFAVVVHLLSVQNNWRLRLRAFCPDDDMPMIDSVTEVWPSANWFEREAFDLLGIVFAGHSDLRRILTDYGFIGHPFRKDFPMSGTVEMRYDPQSRRVVYEPVSIEPRNNVPRIVREADYADSEQLRKG